MDRHISFNNRIIASSVVTGVIFLTATCYHLFLRNTKTSGSSTAAERAEAPLSALTIPVRKLEARNGVLSNSSGQMPSSSKETKSSPTRKEISETKLNLIANLRYKIQKFEQDNLLHQFPYLKDGSLVVLKAMNDLQHRELQLTLANFRSEVEPNSEADIELVHQYVEYMRLFDYRGKRYKVLEFLPSQNTLSDGQVSISMRTCCTDNLDFVSNGILLEERIPKPQTSVVAGSSQLSKNFGHLFDVQ